ncbi:MAG: hypothetical protein JXB23_05995 [Candidatus Aminicenantes bacterium]|nr:hypothetical protein [Candidatus Aminicenantes bacterium]
MFHADSGNIGYHHVHHVRPLIPNYNLEECYKSEPVLQNVKPITIRDSLHSLRLRLWDEAEEKLVSFGTLKNKSMF